ncbi:NAD(P)H-dependent glycerol-3-phosphate dehydrogenase [Streptomyces sp. NPDC046161]|uniref:NAD(P)H-dependent glycerol-3-phosphate dehydrogenase n=1 Tax=Streptomyces sp. NPDC046161 TaxID=3155132 RepID=UPI0033D87530
MAEDPLQRRPGPAGRRPPAGSGNPSSTGRLSPSDLAGTHRAWSPSSRGTRSRDGRRDAAERTGPSHLAGIGGLMATCSSSSLPKRTFGKHLRLGLTVAQRRSHRIYAESVKSANSVTRPARRHGVDVPITDVAAKMLHCKVTVDQAAADAPRSRSDTRLDPTQALGRSHQTVGDPL